MCFTLLPRNYGLLPEYVRFSGVVTSAGQGDSTIWIDVPEALAADAPSRLDAWLLWLLPHAFETQQELILRGAVDPELLQNVCKLMEIWSRWRPNRKPIRVWAEPSDGPASPVLLSEQPVRTGLFFTAGIDSFFTLFHHDETIREHHNPFQRPIDDLINVWGFDIPLGEVNALRAKQASLATIANRTGKVLVTLVTNLRETAVKQPWGAVMHGPALGGVGILLGRRWRKTLLSSWYTRGDIDQWGSTAITDPLLSTSTTRTEPYGAGHDRFEKLAYIARHPIVLKTLHVCWEDRSEKNCGRCEKCYRTLLALDVLGIRDRATTFPPGPIHLGRLAEVWKDTSIFASMYKQLRVHASAAGRSDVIAAIDSCLYR
jgi:hypothetical protein